MKSNLIILCDEERKLLESRTRGNTRASEARRARCLLLAAEGLTEEAISAAVGCGTATVTRVKARYRSEGWEAAVIAKKSSGRPHSLGSLAERSLIALACTEFPHGSRWTVRALASATGVSRMTVQRTLHRDGIKPWREKNVVHRRA